MRWCWFFEEKKFGCLSIFNSVLDYFSVLHTYVYASLLNQAFMFTRMLYYIHKRAIYFKIQSPSTTDVHFETKERLRDTKNEKLSIGFFFESLMIVVRHVKIAFASFCIIEFYKATTYKTCNEKLFHCTVETNE